MSRNQRDSGKREPTSAPNESSNQSKTQSIARCSHRTLSLAKTPALPAEGKKFDTFVITWHERWAQLFETFMAGSNVSTTDASAPASLTQALLAEIIATQWSAL